MTRLLVIGYVWPEPTSSAAGSRMLQLLRFFRKQDYEITFATIATRNEFAADLEDLGVTAVKIELNNSSFDQFIEHLQPEVVLFDRFMMEEQFGWRVSEVCPEAVKILDTEDLHFLRKLRETSYKKGIPEEELLFSSEVAKREIASIYRCDLSLIISEPELILLQDFYKVNGNLLMYLPFLPEEVSAEKIDQLPSFSERAHFISIGNFLHEPNWNAVLYLKENIWPLIKDRLPNAEMHVYGAYPSQKVFNLHNNSERFLVKGRAQCVEHAMQEARVCLAPLQFGAGLKGKFFDAMQAGTPCITTGTGAEGIASNKDWNGCIANGPKAFANAAVDLYTQKELWEEAQKKGFKILDRRFSKIEFENLFIENLQELREKLQKHRRKNFIGAMLQHHQHRSTYFMSKYIELKNKQK